MSNLYESTDAALAANPRFRIERLLGRGARGAVYAAFDRVREQRVALKALQRMDPASLYRFKNEFRSLADIAHPNLVVLYELLFEAGQWLFTMELVEGMDFMSYVRGDADGVPHGAPEAHERPSPQSPQAADQVPTTGMTPDTSSSDEMASGSRPGRRRSQEIGKPARIDLLRVGLRQLAEAVAALHQTGHLHRDIKPSNVLVTEKGRVVVLDFGIVTALAGHAKQRHFADEVVGTPAFMAPEQALRDAVATPANDWYSVGVMLYQALTGRLPFSGSVRQLIRSKQTIDPLPPRRYRPDAPEDLDTLCMELLRRDPLERPTGEDILARLAAPGPQLRVSAGRRKRISDAAATLLVGREQHLAALSHAFADVEQGTNRVVVVPGCSGMGKSMLIEHFVDDLERRGRALALRGRCYEGESVPYKALDSLVDALCGHLAGLPRAEIELLTPQEFPALLRAFPVLGRVPTLARAGETAASMAVDATQLRQRASAGLRELLGNLAQRKPVVLFIDDLHWGDVDSAPMLSSLAGPQAPPLLLITSYRSEEADASPLLRTLNGTWHPDGELATYVEQLPVEELAPQKATELAGKLLEAQQLPTTLAERVARESEGSPYFIDELVRFAASERAGEGGPATAAMSLNALILARVGGLSAAAQRLLQVVATAAGRISQGVVREAAGLQAGHNRVLAELRAGHFVRTTGAHASDEIETYHDQVRQMVLSTLTRDAKRRLHGSLAAALEASAGEGPEHVYALARHYYLSRSTERAQRAFDVNVLAGRTAAESYAYSQAFQFLEQARQIASQAGLETDATFEQLFGDMCACTGRLGQAVASFRSALGRSNEPLQRAVLRLGLAKVYLGQLDSAASSTEARHALAEIGHKVPRTGSGRLLRSLWAWLRGMSNLHRKARFGSASGVQRQTCQVAGNLYTHLALTSYFEMDRVGLLSNTLMILRPAALLGPSRQLAEWYMGGMAVAAFLRKGPLARRMANRVLELAKALGEPTTLGRALLYRAFASHFLGATQEAADRMRCCLAEHGSWLENYDYLTGIADLSWNLLMRGYAREGREWLERGLKRAALAAADSRMAEGHTYRCYAGPLLAMLGSPEAGGEHLDRYAELLETVAGDRWRHGQYLAHRALWQLLADELGDGLEATIEAHQKLALSPKRLPMQLRHFYVAQATARLTQLERTPPSERKRAHQRCREALRQLEQTAKYETLQCHRLVLEARFRRIDGHPARARRWLDRAEQLAQSTDNPWVLCEVALERARVLQANGQSAEARSQGDGALDLARRHGWAPKIRAIEQEFSEMEDRAE